MEKVKLLIVDDEAYIRQGIRRAIPWESHGVEVVGEAPNGEEALQLCHQMLPDIVLADIRMPRMNGLELAKVLGERMPHVKVVVLTAYTDPELFCEAIDVQVSSFVVKSADSNRILEAVLKAKEQYLEEKQDSEYNYRMQNIYQDHQQFIKESLFRQFFGREIPHQVFSSKATALNLPLGGPVYTLLAAELSGEVGWNLSGRCHTLLQPYDPFLFRLGDTRLVVVMNTEAAGVAHERMCTLAQELSGSLRGNEITYMNGIPTLAALPDSYEKLTEAFAVCFWNADAPCLAVERNLSFLSPDYARLEEAEKEMLAAAMTGDLRSVRRALQGYLEELAAQLVPRGYFLATLERVLLVVAARPGSEGAGPRAVIDAVREITRPQQAIERFDQLFLAPEEPGPARKQMALALDYIEHNYQEDIHLADVAAYAYLSESYLSRLFKAETGASFREWLNRVRIEKAMQLVADTDLKYYEIAEQVGYRNYKYFATHFSKYCGCSAKEYRMAAARSQPPARQG